VFAWLNAVISSSYRSNSLLMLLLALLNHAHLEMVRELEKALPMWSHQQGIPSVRRCCIRKENLVAKRNCRLCMRLDGRDGDTAGLCASVVEVVIDEADQHSME
jgi:hypothetical protein